MSWRTLILGNPSENLARLNLSGFSTSYCTEEFFLSVAQIRSLLIKNKVEESVYHLSVSLEFVEAVTWSSCSRREDNSCSLGFQFCAFLTACLLSSQ